MRRSLTYLTLVNLVFLTILSASSFFDGIVGRIIYYAAFIIPLLLGFLIRRLDKEEKLNPPRLSLDKEGAFLSLPLVIPTLALVLLLSFLTSLLLSLFGAENNTPDVSGNIFVALLLHALVPSLLEEGLFRYLPIAILSPYSRRTAVLASALFFSLIHCNLFQMPYAFIAGIIFATVDIMTDSIWPSVLIHFVNNTASVFWLRYNSNEQFTTVYLVVIGVLTAISLIPVFVFRKKYAERLSYAFNNECKEKLSFSPFALAAVCILIALMSL